MSYEPLMPSLEALSKKAGQKIMEFYKADIDINYKADQSPATIADVSAELIIINELKKLTPDIPIVAEEQMATGYKPTIKHGAPFWLVDPLDGTKEFIHQTDEFTVNIALIENHQPILGVIYAPALGELYSGYCVDAATIGNTNIRYNKPVTVITSRRSKTLNLPPNIVVNNHIKCGSSLKFCRLATKQADYYPRLGPTMEWDTAAGHAILKAHGGNVFDAETGIELRYQKDRFKNPGFVAVGPGL